MTGELELFHRVVLSRLLIVIVLGGRFGDYIRWVDSRLVMLSHLAMCRFGLAVLISQFWILVILIRMQTSFAVVVSGFGLNVKQRTSSSGACCSHSLFRPGMPFEVWCCG